VQPKDPTGSLGFLKSHPFICAATGITAFQYIPIETEKEREIFSRGGMV